MQEGLQLTRLSIQCTIDERRSLVFDLVLVLCRGRQDSSQLTKHVLFLLSPVFASKVFDLSTRRPPPQSKWTKILGRREDSNDCAVDNTKLN